MLFPSPVINCHTFSDNLPPRAWRTLWTAQQVFPAPSFVLLLMHPSFLLRICPCLSLPHVLYFLTILSYLHHHILCRLLRFHLICRLSSVPLMRCRLAPSSVRADSILYVDYHLHPLAVGFCPHRICQFSAFWSAPCLKLHINYIYLYQSSFDGITVHCSLFWYFSYTILSIFYMAMCSTWFCI